MSSPEQPSVLLISSPDNPRAKLIRSLRLPKFRDKHNSFLLENPTLLNEAIEAGATILDCFVDESLRGTTQGTRLMAGLAHTGSDAAWASQKVLKSVSALESPPLTVAVLRRKTSGLPDLILASPQLIVLGEDIQDPANVGAIIRTCAAAGFPALVLCGASADFYNPKVVRSAAGAILRCLLTRHPDAAEVITILRRAGYRVVATVNAGGVDYLDASMLAPTALLFGNEAKGLKESTLALADVKLHIPLSPGVDSLNVAACCAILLYEALRQRRSPPS